MIRLIIRRNTLFAGLQHLNWKFNVLVHRKTAIHSFAFAFVTGYLSCQIFLMTFVNKELTPVANSISFGTNNIGSDLQRNQKKSVPNWSTSVWPDANIWTRSLRIQGNWPGWLPRTRVKFQPCQIDFTPFCHTNIGKTSFLFQSRVNFFFYLVTEFIT